MPGKSQAPPQARKPKTVSRFRNLAGDGAGSVAGGNPDSTGGIVGGLEAARQMAGHRIREVEVSSLIPHPFNDSQRSTAQPDDPKWAELVRSVRAQGILTPGLAVTRAAFAAARPTMAQHLPDAGSHVLVFGHRRRAAAIEAGISTMPMVIDDSAMNEDGDLDAMAVENLGRKDLTPLAEAQLFARYSEDLGLKQADIADRLGVDQATVSRRLALLLLAEEVLDELEAGRLPVATAAALASAMPYGPHRKWQKSKNPEQNSPNRRTDQIAALSMILERNSSPTRAAERILAERASRDHATAQHIRVIDNPQLELGPNYLNAQIDDPDDTNNVVATIDDSTGTLVYYSTAADEPEADISPGTRGEAPDDVGAETPHEPSGPATTTAPKKNRSDDTAAHAQSKKLRARACDTAAGSTPGKPRLAEILAAAIAAGLDLQRPSVVTRADNWHSGEADSSAEFKHHAAIAWRRVLAAYEDAVERRGQWGTLGRTYLDLLHERTGYVPTSWERQQAASDMQPA